MFVAQDDFDVELTWRVAVVGSTATGKSSLVRRFCGRSPNLKQLGESGGRAFNEWHLTRARRKVKFLFPCFF